MNNRARLKEATRAWHERAENAWFAAGRFESRAHYIRWLAAMRDVHQSLGQASAAILQDPGLDHLEQDRRRYLNCDLGRPSASRWQDVPTSQGPAWAWGVQYALNGSALGAAILLKSDHLKEAWPTAYLTAMQRYAKTGGLRAFFDRLNAEMLEPAASQAGAEAVFQMLMSQQEASAPA